MSEMFSWMADETVDIANIECLCWVDENLENHEDFICLPSPSSTNAEHLELNVSEGKRQCYDEAANNGIAKRLKGLNPKVLVVHCFGNFLNLSLPDFINKVKPMKDAFETGK